MINLLYTGLVVIAFAWLVQLYFLSKGKREICKSFVIVYILGVVCLVIADFQANMASLAYFEMACSITSFLVLIKLLWS